MVNKKIFKEQVRNARNYLQMKQSELSQITGISVENIQRLEKGFGEIKSYQVTKNSLYNSLTERGIIFAMSNKNIPYIMYDPDQDVLGYLKKK